MTNPYQHKATKAYQSVNDENMSPLQVVAELYKGIIKFLYEGKAAYETNKLDVMSEKIARILAVIESLQANLDLDKGGKDAAFLEEFYMILSARLGRILDRPNVAHEFDQLIAYVMPVYERWHEFAYGPRSSKPEEK
ncbi:MAG: flagellar export chaperone FliS [Pseudomonadota bacterium]